ncbi:YkuS family protein [Clostridium sp. Marseille-Q2269]|uniref:YkuS family protein n=1 Tax=Clostridium sp. Marseille-Q2269 TaxID=2942205 RepID=UPI002073FBD1|nr:YkuS family protein [Clostridium sp. Marseille-Q2269]
MNIFVSDALQNLKNSLQNRGYSTHSNNNYDVIICDLKEDMLISTYLNNNKRNTNILIIDSAGKTIEEIENILNFRMNDCII